jgi:hypothetical protein
MPNLIAVPDGTQNFGNTRRAIAFYQVDGLPTSTTPPTGSGTFFNQVPLFVVWSGYEGDTTLANDFEDLNAFNVDPISGVAYQLAYDSGTPGSVDASGDTGGDYDLYKFDLMAIYNDFITNARAKGTMYAPAVAADGFDYVAAFGSAAPAVSGSGIAGQSADAGIPPLRSNEDADTTNNIVFTSAIIKAGEVGRRGAAAGFNTPFFDQQEIAVVAPGKIVLMENTPVTLASGAADDYSIRSIEMVEGTPTPKADNTGGYDNGQAQEKWESFAWTGDNYVGLDNGAAGDISDVDGMKLVERDGVQGVWVSDRDGGGDDFAFFALDFENRIATKQELRTSASPFPTSFALDENPNVSANTNDGDVDTFYIDEDGNLVIGESGNSDSPQAEPKIIRRVVNNYAAGDTDSNSIQEVTFGAWNTSANIIVNGGIDDDTLVTDGRFGVYNPGDGLYYFFDADSGAAPGVVGDIYVVDPNTGAVVYAELNAANQFFNQANTRAFTLGGSGDTIAPTVAQAYAYQTEQSITFTYSEALASSGAGAFSASDITLTNTTTSTVIPTADLTLVDLGGNVYKLTYKAGAAINPLPKGVYTLTLNAPGITDVAGNALTAPTTLTFKVNPGDSNQDGDVDFDDLLTLAQNYGSTGKNYSQGNFNYDASGTVGFDDLLLLAQNYGTTLVKATPAPKLAASATAKRKTVSSDVLA